MTGILPGPAGAAEGFIELSHTRVTQMLSFKAMVNTP